MRQNIASVGLMLYSSDISSLISRLALLSCTVGLFVFEGVGAFSDSLLSHVKVGKMLLSKSPVSRELVAANPFEQITNMSPQVSRSTDSFNRQRIRSRVSEAEHSVERSHKVGFIRLNGPSDSRICKNRFVLCGVRSG